MGGKKSVRARRFVLPVIAVLGLAATAAPAAAAGAGDAPARDRADTTRPGRVRLITSFDAAAGELPEGIVVDAHRNMFVTLAPRGELVRIDRHGNRRLVAQVAPAGKGFGALGLAFDRRGGIVVAVASFDPATAGVVRVVGHRTERIPGTEQITFPNGLAFGPRGALFVTDSAGGAVWRVGRDGSVEKWSEDPLLAGNGSLNLGVPLGANGIAYWRGSFYVVNTETGRIVRIPVTRDGAGPAEIVAEGPELIGADGAQFDARGNLYVAVNGQSTLLRLSPDGTLTTLATAADGLDAPASPVFGVGRGDRSTLYVTNFAFGHTDPSTAHPGIVALDAGVRGAPLPATSWGRHDGR